MVGLVCGIVLWLAYGLTRPVPLTLDFPQFYAAGRLVVEHRAADLQDGAALSQEVIDHVSPSLQWVLLPIYGPQVGLLMAPLGFLPYRGAELIWVIASAALYAWVVQQLFRDCRQLRKYGATTWLLAAASPAFFQVIRFGQLSMVALALTVLGFSLLERGRAFGAGLAFGALVYKPQYALAIAVVFGLTRTWPVIMGALASAFAQLAIAWVYGGTALMRQYAATVVSAPWQLGALQSRPHQMQSLLALARLLPGPVLPLVVYGGLVVVVLIVTYRVWTRSTALRLRQSTLVLGGLLISPHVYVYDLVMLTPVFFWLTDWMLSDSSDRPPVTWCLSALYLWPVAGLILTYYISLNFGPLIMLVLLGVVSAAALSAPVTVRQSAAASA